MAGIKQPSSVLNLPEDGKLGFGLPPSNAQFNWRNNPSLVLYRDYRRSSIQVYLAQNVSGEVGEFAQEIYMFAAYLENQLFMDALSENDYMDKDKFLNRLKNLINRRWLETSTAQKQAMHVTNSLPMCASAPTLGPLKRTFSTNLGSPELVMPYVCSSESADSGTTYSGSVLHYDSEASFESDRYRSQNFTEGKLNLVISSDQNSPSVRTPAMVLEPLHYEQQHSHLKSHCNGCFGEIKSLGSLSMQSGNSSMSQCTTMSTLSNMERDLAVKLLRYYVTYNNQGNQVPFMELLHSQKCKGGICGCEKYKVIISHYDNCGSANCGICGSVVTICSGKPVIQSGSEKQNNGFKGLTCGSNCGKRLCINTSEDSMKPAKARKLNASPERDSSFNDSALTEEPISPSGPLNFEQVSASPVMTTITNQGAIKETATGFIVDASGIGDSDTNHLDDVQRCTSGDAIDPLEDRPADFQLQVEMVTSPTDDAARINQVGNGALDDIQGSSADDAIYLSGNPFLDKVSESCELPSSDPNLLKDKLITQNLEFTRGSSPEKTLLNIKSREDFLPTVASWTRRNSKKQTVDGISSIDCFTPEEVKQHISSLKQKAEQDIPEGIVANRAGSSLSENSCQLCDLDKLAFSPLPIYCTSCAIRIKNHATYYFGEYDNREFCFCSTCYNKCHRGTFTLQDWSISKTNLAMKKNDVVTVESWVQCDKCEGWQHQICALFNDRKDLGGKAVYHCPMCYLKDLESGEQMPLPRSTSLDARNLPRTLLSDQLEQRLFRRLKQERENRAKAAGKNPEEVPQPADLVVRVVSSVDKRLKVKQSFLNIFPEKNYPSEFPYRAKVILLFQRIEGVDVCLFAMYVQEFGSECSQPNQRCVYISYLDSVKYFRPDIKTVKGEALRTFVYHEILVGYLDYCKKRGFATCYIWACPPTKGEDYILYCHPETQKTPRPDKLRQWYQSMLKKATEEKVAVNFSNYYEKFFVPTGESNTKVTAARLPYFDGDYWSSNAEHMIKKIELDSGGDPQKQVNKMTRRSLKAMGHSNPSADDAKDILLMQALGQNLSSAKEDFIIVYLHFICSHCHEVILSGQRWFCNQCKNYQLCGRCHDAGQESGVWGTHISNSGQTHTLSQEAVNDVPVDTENNDVILGKCFLEERRDFLTFCEVNHYQFDSLRRAKHSSMMILYHLHNPKWSMDGTLCNLCLKDIGAVPRWICEECPEFSLCCSCHQRSDPSSHKHTLVHHQPTPIMSRDTTVTKIVKRLLNVVLHASQCRTPLSQTCPYPDCTHLRRLFTHTRTCTTRVTGGCRYCYKIWLTLSIHSKRCKDPNCSVPRCMDLKNHLAKARNLDPTQELSSRCLQSINLIT